MGKEMELAYWSSCPVCGRTLFRGAPDSCIEGGCPKCKEHLKINFYYTGYKVCIMNQNQKKEKNIASCIADETKIT